MPLNKSVSLGHFFNGRNLYAKKRSALNFQLFQHFGCYLCYQAKVLGRTITNQVLCKFTNERSLAGQFTLRKLAKSILFGIVLVQIIVYLLISQTTSKPFNPHADTEQQDEAVDLVKQISEDIWHRHGHGIAEKRAGERRIKSYDGISEQQINKIKLNLLKKKQVKPKESNSYSNVNGIPKKKSTMPLCPEYPPNLFGRLEFHFNDTPPTFEQVAKHNPHLHKGGFYQPSDCVARTKVAVIIPHRSRELHLRALLWHLHPIFQRQQLHYKIYVAHQAYNLAFNKAKMMNIGFLEAMKDDDYDCIVFHDVDLLPEDDRLLYTCKEMPKHLSVAIDKYGYRLPYTSLFGGVTMLSMEQFRDVNGYSNMYWGWGGEDDDMFNRIFSRGYTIHRPPLHLARYKMSFHHRDKGNRLNLMRYEILSRSVHRMQEDGLNNVKYSIVKIDETPIFTNITADVGTAVVQCKTYLSEWTCHFVLWMCEYLTLSCGMLQYNSTDDGTFSLNINNPKL